MAPNMLQDKPHRIGAESTQNDQNLVLLMLQNLLNMMNWKVKMMFDNALQIALSL